MATQLQSVIPKLPSRDLKVTKSFYTEQLNFQQVGGDYPDYLMLHRDGIELHFFLHCELDVLQNDGMCYIRVSDIEELYDSMKKNSGEFIRQNLGARPWGQKEFAIVDHDHNLLTFGEHIERD